MIELISRSEAQTRLVAARLAAGLRGGDVVALHGPLGAGKTCFVRGLAEGLGIDPREVSSPTFILCQEYEPPEDRAGGPALTHLDGYRLSSPNELETIGFDELLAAREAVLAIEWPERFGDALPDERIHVELEHVNATMRRLRIEAPRRLQHDLKTACLAEPEARQSGTSAMICPTCQKPVSDDLDTFPFCGERCRLVDLGAWFNERYRTSRALSETDEFE